MKFTTLIFCLFLFNIKGAWALNVMHVKHTSSKEFLGAYHYENLSDINRFQTALRYSYINRPLYALTADQKSISQVIITNNQILSLAIKAQVYDKFQTELITHAVISRMGKDEIKSLADSELIVLYPFINQNDWILNLGGKLILPTGSNENYTSGKSIGYGAFFNFEKRETEYLAILNIGLTFQNKNHYQIVDLSNLLDFTLGYVQAVYQKLKFGFEINRSTTFATDQGQNAGENLLILGHPVATNGMLQIGFGVEGFTALEVEKRIGTVKFTQSF